MTFEEIQTISGLSIDHSFLTYEKELAEYGYQVGKISMKEQTVIFNKTCSERQVADNENAVLFIKSSTAKIVAIS